VLLAHVVASVEPLDPMFPYMQYYDLANYSIDTFVKIRCEVLLQYVICRELSFV